MKTNLFKDSFMLVGFVVVSLLVLTFISEGEISAENKLPITQKQGKANPKISSLITKSISKMQSLGITRENAESVYASSISDPLVKVDNSGNIQTYIYMENMNQDNISTLESMNVKIEIVNSKFNLIQAWVPFDKVEEVAGLNFVKKITPPSYGILRTGSVNSEGDVVMRSDDVREDQDLGFDGTGVRIGVISDGVDSIDASQATGDLPSDVIINPSLPGSGDEGTALLEIIHDIAPGAELAFSEGFSSSATFINSLNFLVNDADVDIIVDDIGFLNEPYFQDGMVAQAVADASEKDVVYVSAAGNNADEHYQADYFNGPSGVISGIDNPHDFGVAEGGQSDIAMPVSVFPNNSIVVILQWNDPFDGSSNDYDLFLFDDKGNLLDSSVGLQTGSQDPIEIVTYKNPTPGLVRVNVVINRFSGSPLITLEMNFNGTIFVEDFNVPSDGVFGHPAVEDVIAVGAVPATPDEFCPGGASGPNEVEVYSSQGPSTFFFTPSGTPLPVPEQRQKPDVVAPDGIHITGAGGFGTADGKGGFYFCGTSASAPHVAGVAALILDKNPNLTPIEVADAIKNTAFPLNLVASLTEQNLVETQAFSDISGFGIVDAFNAVQSAPAPPTPTPTPSPTPSPTPTPPNSGGGGCSIGEKANVSQSLANLLVFLLPITILCLKKIKSKVQKEY